MYAYACMYTFSMYMHVYRCLEEGNYDNCCRLPNILASIIWMGNSRKGEEKKTVICFFVVGSKRKEEREREREREREGAVDEASLLFSSLSLIIQYV